MRAVIVFLLTFAGVQPLQILGLFPHEAYSHFLAFQPLLEALAERGHNVTVIGMYPSSRKLPRYNNVVLQRSDHSFKPTLQLNINKYTRINSLHYFATVSCGENLSGKTYHDFLKSAQRFDVILTEFFNSNCLLTPILQKHNIPVIGLSSHVLIPWTNDWMGNPDNPSYIPMIFLGHSDRMSFLERIENTLLVLYSKMYFRYIIQESQMKMIRKYVRTDSLHADHFMYNTSLILVNSHFSLNRPRPLVPNIIEVAGLHIGKAKRVPTNIEKWINESTHGIIYFSLGSMIKGHTFPEEKRQMFLRAFGRLPQRVLWKWETEMPGKPDNIMTQKWMPQFDILCHPNVKVFISHGGLLGSTEAVHCGVPMIIMPQYGDQFTNAKAVEASGGGVILDFRSLDEESIYNALTTVLDPSFNKKAKELSARFRDRPLPPLDTAIYWVEYVARHKGAPHMRTAAVGMPFYQYFLLDVIAFLAVILFVITYTSYRVTKAIWRKLFVTNKVKTN